MRNQILTIVAVSALIGFAAVDSASAEITSTRTVNNGFKTCTTTRQTGIGNSQSTRNCSGGLASDVLGNIKQRVEDRIQNGGGGGGILGGLKNRLGL